MERLTNIFKALSEPLRLRIVRLLMASGREAYGEELARALSVPPYQLSRHLKVLRNSGLVQERKEGRWVYYSIAKSDGGSRVLGTLRRLLTEAHDPSGAPPPFEPSTEPSTSATESREPALTSGV